MPSAAPEPIRARPELWLTRLSLALGGLALARVAWAGVSLARGSEAWRVQYLPDDGFYYLQLAKSFATTGTWSFDGGVSLTSGFHPLMAYSLAAIYWLGQPSDAAFVSWAIALSCALALGAGWLLCLVANKLGGPVAALGVGLLLASDNYLLNAAGFMESSWVLVCAALFLLARTGPRPPLQLLLLGFVGSLARTDFVLLPACLALVSLLSRWRSPEARRLGWRDGAGLGGAFLGLAATFVHSRITSGEWLQSSALMKAHWAEVVGPSPGSALNLVSELLGPRGLAVAAVLLVVALARSIRRRSFALPAELVPTYGGALALPAYVALYSLGYWSQPWYTATLAVPALCCVAAIETNLPRLGERVSWPSLALGIGALLAAGLVLARFSLARLPAPWIHHQSLFEAGRSLAKADLGRIGAWNSGIVGYYQGGHVVNLDGLVNNDVYPYAIRNALPEYIAAQRIDYVVEFTRTLEERDRRRKGGYNDSAFLFGLKEQRVFGKPYPYWGTLTLFRVSPR